MVVVALTAKGSFVMNTENAAEGVYEQTEPRRPMRVKEAADLVGVTPKTIRNWIETGKIPGYRYGYNRFIVDRDDIEPLVGFRRIEPKGGVR